MKRTIPIILIIMLTIGSGYLYYRLDEVETEVSMLRAYKDVNYAILKHFKNNVSKEEFATLSDSLNKGVYENRYLLSRGLGEDIFYAPRGINQYQKLKYNPFIRISYFDGTVLLQGLIHENKSIENRKELLTSNYYYDQAMTLKGQEKKTTFDEGFIILYPNGFVEKHFTKGELKGSVMSYTDTVSEEWKSKKYPRLNL